MSAPKPIEPASVLPRTVWHAILHETTVEVFSMMVGVAVTSPAKDALATAINRHCRDCRAIRAIFILQCSSASSVKIASQMLGMAPDDPACEKTAGDAVGEVCNIVAGYFKAKIGLGETCMLSVPTVIAGQDYHFHSDKACERLEFPLLFEGETLWITLEIAQ
jgi:chemotaxis protein CheY-P-specific phosphatase CheC